MVLLTNRISVLEPCKKLTLGVFMKYVFVLMFISFSAFAGEKKIIDRPEPINQGMNRSK